MSLHHIKELLGHASISATDAYLSDQDGAQRSDGGDRRGSLQACCRFCGRGATAVWQQGTGFER